MIKPIKFKVGRGKQEDLPIKYIDGFIWFATDTGKLYIDAPVDGTLERTLINPEADWSQIQNKPEDIPSIYYNTVEGWANQSNLIGKRNALYVYTDAYMIDGKVAPDIKIGDGSSYLIDTPYLSSADIRKQLEDHINDNSIHVTAEEKEFWNNKVRAYHSTIQDETIVFTTD